VNTLANNGLMATGGGISGFVVASGRRGLGQPANRPFADRAAGARRAIRLCG